MLEHEQKKPDEKSDDPEDAEAYRKARENMGDYKLKTAKDYVVPKAQRIGTEKKRREILLLRQRVSTEYNNGLGSSVGTVSPPGPVFLDSGHQERLQ